MVLLQVIQTHGLHRMDVLQLHIWTQTYKYITINTRQNLVQIVLHIILSHRKIPIESSVVFTYMCKSNSLKVEDVKCG